MRSLHTVNGLELASMWISSFAEVREKEGVKDWSSPLHSSVSESITLFIFILCA